MARTKSGTIAWRDDPARVRPMLATVTTDPPDKDLENPSFVYEPKYDGIRALVALEPGQPAPRRPHLVAPREREDEPVP